MGSPKKRMLLRVAIACASPLVLAAGFALFAQTQPAHADSLPTAVKYSSRGAKWKIDKRGRALSGAREERFFLPSGEMAGKGTWLSEGKFYAVDSDGAIDEELSKSVNDAATKGAGAATLLGLLGAPEKVTESDSCLDYGGCRGTDKVYQYANFKVQTFACDELGEVYWDAY